MQENTIIDAVADEFERAWRAGEGPDIRRYVEGRDESTRRNLLVELLLIEMECKIRAGHRWELDEVLVRHPELESNPEGMEEIRRRRKTLVCDAMTTSLTNGSARLATSLKEASVPRSAPGAGGEKLEQIGDYRVNFLCTSGQADIYTAMHPTLHRQVVVKICRSRASARAIESMAFLKEGERLAKLDHSHVARVLDSDTHHGRPYLVLEYIEGRNLRQFMEDTHPTPLVYARLLAQVARAVHSAHAHGIVHCDLKPGNIMIDEAGQAKVIDFGMSRIRDAWSEDAASAAFSGTVPYMSPEQATPGGTITARSDVFSLGCVLYWLIVGRAPFADDASSAGLARVARCEFDAIAVQRARAPRQLKRICLDAMHCRPEDRIVTAERMAERLERFCRRPTLRTVALVAVAVAAIAAAGVWLVTRPSPQQQQPEEKILTPLAASTLQVHVWTDRAREGSPWGERLSVLDAIPVGPRHRLRVSMKIRPGAHAMIALLDSEGHWSVGKSFSPAAEFQEVYWPDAKEAAKFDIPSGTLVFVLCTSERGPVALDEIKAIWPQPVALPALPEDSLIEVTSKGVFTIQQSRRFDITAVVDPELDVRQRLEQFRRASEGKFAELYGTAMPFVNDGEPNVPRPRE